LRGRAEPSDDHEGIVDAAEATEAVPEGSAVGVGMEDLEVGVSRYYDGEKGSRTVEFRVGMVVKRDLGFFAKSKVFGYVYV
jgi:hypothetical protein